MHADPRKPGAGIPFWASRAARPPSVAGTEKRVTRARVSVQHHPLSRARQHSPNCDLEMHSASHRGVANSQHRCQISVPLQRPSCGSPAAAVIMLHSGPLARSPQHCPVMCKMRNVQTRPNCRLAQSWPYQSSPSCCSHKGATGARPLPLWQGVFSGGGEAGMNRLVFSLSTAENIRTGCVSGSD